MFTLFFLSLNVDLFSRFLLFFFILLNQLALFIPPTLFLPSSVPLVPCGDVSPVTNKLM